MIFRFLVEAQIRVAYSVLRHLAGESEGRCSISEGCGEVGGRMS